MTKFQNLGVLLKTYGFVTFEIMIVVFFLIIVHSFLIYDGKTWNSVISVSGSLGISLYVDGSRRLTI